MFTYYQVCCYACLHSFGFNKLINRTYMKELRNVTSAVATNPENIWRSQWKNILMKYIWMLLVWYSFYWEKLFEGTCLVCTWNISILLQQMLIQGDQSRIFRQTFSLDSWSQGAPMYVVSWLAYFKSSHGKAHWIYT